MSDCSEEQFQRIKYKNIIYILDDDDDEKVAFITGYYLDIEDCIIPRSISYNSNEYIVKGIMRYAFSRSTIKSIQFPSDSELEIIGKGAFNYAQIESITFPSKLIELEEGWCMQTLNLSKIIVDPNNPRYRCVDGKIIIGKSSLEQEDYDELVFCARDATTVKIPESIKYICAYSFSVSKIESITLPSQVLKICENAFYLCQYLERFEIPNDSKLQIIGDSAFDGVEFENIYFPSNLIVLNGGWCDNTKFTQIDVSPKNPRYCKFDDILVIGKSNPQQKIYNEIVLAARNIKEVTIPSFIEHICCCAFNSCFDLEKIKFLDDSNLHTIGESAFTFSYIKSITISSKITRIGQNAFFGCENLQIIDIKPDSKIQIIEENTFFTTMIERILIPSEVKRIEEGAFNCCSNLKQVEFSSDSKLQVIAKRAFFKSAIISLIIPPNVTNIGIGAFGCCEELQIIEFDDNSKIECIHQNIFQDFDDDEINSTNDIFVDTILMVPVNVVKRLKL